MLWSKVKLNRETWDEDAEAIEMEQERAGWATIIGPWAGEDQVWDPVSSWPYGDRGDGQGKEITRGQ